MPLHHALLSLLAERDSYGYELKPRWESLAGPQWGPVNIGNIYSTLKRMERDGLITAVDAIRDQRYPERTIYSITPTGREELIAWRENPIERASGDRSDLVIKLYDAGKESVEAIHRICEIEREASKAELQTLRTLRRTQTIDSLALVTIELAILRVQSHIAIADLIDSNAEEHHRSLLRLQQAETADTAQHAPPPHSARKSG